MTLTPEEINSHLFRKLRTHFEERAAQHRVKNDGNLGEIDTARLRGKIAEDLYFVSLASPVKGMKEVSAAD